MKTGCVIVIRKEREPYSRTGYAFRAYYEDGSPMYLGAETLDEIKARVQLDSPAHTVRVET